MKNFLELKNIIDAVENNAAKFYEKGSASTGTGLRNPCNSLKLRRRIFVTR